MNYGKLLLASIFVVGVALLASSCPGASGTFDYPIANFGLYNLTELKLYESQTATFVNVLDSAVPQNTLRIIKLNSARFADNLSELTFKTDQPESGSVNSIVVQAGHTGFRYEATASETQYGLFTFDDQTKAGLEAATIPSGTTAP